MIRLVEYRLTGRYRSVLDRVDLVLDQAAEMIAERERRSLGRVEVAVTIEEGIPDLVCAAHERLFGRSDWNDWAGPGRHGVATLNTAGTLVVINAQALRSVGPIRGLRHLGVQSMRLVRIERPTRRPDPVAGLELLPDRLLAAPIASRPNPH